MWSTNLVSVRSLLLDVVRSALGIVPYREEGKMEGMAIAGVVVASIAAFEVLTFRFGRDSRDGDDWLIHERSVR